MNPDRPPYRVLATDYDGTLAPGGTVPPEAVQELEAFVAAGFDAVLVTGRILSELEQAVPRLGLFRYVVAENGPVLFCPSSGSLRLLAEPPPDEFVAALRKRGVTPLQIGQVVVATREPHGPEVLECIDELGLELHIVFNKGAVMVLPASASKGIGLSAALAEMGVPVAATVGVGDAENDHSLLATCGLGVAVANAVDSLKERADLVLSERSALGVVELMRRMRAGDLPARTRQDELAAEPIAIVNAVPVTPAGADRR